MDTLVSILLGAISGVISLWLTIYFFSPKIKLSSQAIHTPNIRGDMKYCFKYQNDGWRTAIDLNFRLLLVVRGLRLPESHNTYLYTLETATSNSFRTTSMGNNIVRFSPSLSDNSIGTLGLQSEETVDILKSGRLEEMLSLGEESYLRIQMIASDGRTGFRRYFYSEKITSDEILNSDLHGFYFDDVSTYERRTYSGTTPARKYPKIRTNIVNKNILVIKFIRTFYDLTNYFYRTLPFKLS